MVVLPAPLGPRKPKMTPAGTSRSTPFSAMMSPKRFVRPSQRIAVDTLGLFASGEEVDQRSNEVHKDNDEGPYELVPALYASLRIQKIPKSEPEQGELYQYQGNQEG